MHCRSLPVPSFCFTRKDLFENTVIKRLFSENYKAELKIPKTFEDYNKIAEFLQRMKNWKALFSNLTLGSMGVTTNEIPFPIIQPQKYLYGKDGRTIINDDAGIQAMYELLTAKRYSDEKESPLVDSIGKEFCRRKAGYDDQFQ